MNKLHYFYGFLFVTLVLSVIAGVLAFRGDSSSIGFGFMAGLSGFAAALTPVVPLP